MRNKITLKRLDMSDAIEAQKCGQGHILTDNQIADLWKTACAGKDSEKALTLSYRWAMSMARNLSNRKAHAKVIPASTVAQAGYFLFWTEAATRIKARLVAKELAKKNCEKVYFIPAPNRNIIAFNGWGENDLFSLYLLYELTRQGSDAFLISNEELSITICNDLVNYPIYISNHKAFVDAAVYQRETVLTKIFNQEELKNIEIFNLYGTTLSVNKLEIQFQKTKETIQFPQKWRSVFKSPDIDTLVEKFVGLIESWLKQAYENLKSLNEHRPIHSLNVSTHLFPITALLMRIVKDTNKDVSNWSHSVSNNKIAEILLAMDPPNYIQRVIPSGTDSGSIDTADCVNLDLLKETDASFNFNNPSTKINVVLLGTAHELRGMPLINYERHTTRYVSLIRGLQHKRKLGIDFYVRPKTTWETMGWFQSLTDIKLKEAPASPRYIDMDNLVFLCNSFASGAVIEGLARGIPSFIISPHTTNSYLNLNFDKHMILPSVELALIKLERMAKNFKEFDNIRREQISWFTRLISHRL